MSHNYINRGVVHKLTNKPSKVIEHLILKISFHEVSNQSFSVNGYYPNNEFISTNVIRFFKKKNYIDLLKKHIEDVDKNWEQYFNQFKSENISSEEYERKVIAIIENNICKHCKTKNGMFFGRDLIYKSKFCDKCLNKINKEMKT